MRRQQQRQQQHTHKKKLSLISFPGLLSYRVVSYLAAPSLNLAYTSHTLASPLVDVADTTLPRSSAICLHSGRPARSSPAPPAPAGPLPSPAAPPPSLGAVCVTPSPEVEGAPDMQLGVWLPRGSCLSAPSTRSARNSASTPRLLCWGGGGTQTQVHEAHGGAGGRAERGEG